MMIYLGPIFQRSSFLSYRPSNWYKSTLKAETNGGIQTNVFGFPRLSPFLGYVLAALRENMDHETTTLRRTGPFFLKESFFSFLSSDFPMRKVYSILL